MNFTYLVQWWKKRGKTNCKYGHHSRLAVISKGVYKTPAWSSYDYLCTSSAFLTIWVWLYTVSTEWRQSPHTWHRVAAILWHFSGLVTSHARGSLTHYTFFVLLPTRLESSRSSWFPRDLPEPRIEPLVRSVPSAIPSLSHAVFSTPEVSSLLMAPARLVQGLSLMILTHYTFSYVANSLVAKNQH